MCGRFKLGLKWLENFIITAPETKINENPTLADFLKNTDLEFKSN